MKVLSAHVPDRVSQLCAGFPRERQTRLDSDAGMHSWCFHSSMRVLQHTPECSSTPAAGALCFARLGTVRSRCAALLLLLIRLPLIMTGFIEKERQIPLCCRNSTRLLSATVVFSRGNSSFPLTWVDVVKLWDFGTDRMHTTPLCASVYLQIGLTLSRPPV